MQDAVGNFYSSEYEHDCSQYLNQAYNDVIYPASLPIQNFEEAPPTAFPDLNENGSIHTIPKVETQAWQFLQNYPTADGRGVLIAVLDTGVDPGAPGLQITSEGKVKVIERWDCTGAGDVDTTKKVKPNICEATGRITIVGATGRELEVPQCWKNSCNTYRVGCKPLFDLYPREYRDQIIERRHKYSRIPAYHAELENAKRELEALLEYKRPSTACTAEFHELEIENKRSAVKLLEVLINEIKDVGPMVECVMYKDNFGDWKVCLSVDKQLTNGLILRPYSKFYEFGSLYGRDNYNVSVNVWNDGNLLEIVGMSGDHGTHVAGITAGYFPENPISNGIAPGAQIVSLTIGDYRLDSNETCLAITRAMSRFMKTPQIHVVNTSYGDQCAWAPSGNLFQLIKEVVDNYNITWCCSAGNDGPGISTVKSLAHLTEDVMIGVGAIVTPKMEEVLYSYYATGPASQYTFSSCGPGLNGEMGINICAPGGAIASMPNWSGQGVSLMNGTSMSTPNVVGCISLMLSLAIQRQLIWTPYAVKRSLENTAKILNEPKGLDRFSQGFGLIQVLDAYSALENMHVVDKLVRYDVSVSGGSPGRELKGIYLRDPPPKYPEEFIVKVAPNFFQKETLDPEIILNFRKILKFYTEIPVPWIKYPELIDMYNDEEHKKSFKIMIDPTQIPGPGVHYARIDAGHPITGREFSLHVTVIIPLKANIHRGYPGIDFGTILLGNADVRRYFVNPPSGTTWGVLHATNTFSASDYTSATVPRAVLNVQVTVVEFGEQVSVENRDLLRLNGSEASEFVFPLKAQMTTEIAVAREWNNIGGNIPISIYVEFHGLTIDDSQITVSSAQCSYKLNIQSKLGPEKVIPNGYLFYQTQLLGPKFSPITILTGPREILPHGKAHHALVAEYQFTLEKPTEVDLSCPLFWNCSYESDFVSQMWQLFDNNKRYICAGICEYGQTRQIKIEDKGTYTVLFQLVHEESQVLCQLTKSDARTCLSCMPEISENKINPSLPFLLTLDLPEPIVIPAYRNLSDLAIRTNELDSVIQINERHPLLCYLDVTLSNKDLEDLPGGNPVSFFSGKLFLSEDGCKSDKGVGNFPLQITMPNTPIYVKSKETDSATGDTCERENLVQSYMTHTVSSLNEMEEKLEEATKVFENLSLSTDEISMKTGEIIELANQILNGIDINGVQTFFGAATLPPNSDELKDLRNTIIKTLATKGFAMSKIYTEMPNCGGSTEADLDAIYKTILNHAERSDKRLRKFMIEYFMIKKLYAIAGEILWDIRKDNLDLWSAEYHHKLTLCLFELKMYGFVKLLNDIKPVLFPPNYRPF